MLTGEIRSQIDQIWNAFWSGGISNPLEVIEQITYLLFLKRLDEQEIAEELKANREKKPMQKRFYPEGKDNKKRSFQDYRWNRFKNFDPRDMYTVVSEHVFPWLRTLGGNGTTYSKHMEGARFTIPTPALLAKVVDMIDKVPMEDRDTKGDLYEYMLGKIATAGQNGQFRTPRHIIRLMVEMVEPKPTDIVCDPACGTCGFLVAVGESLRERHPEVMTNAKLRQHFHRDLFHGFDFDNTMLRIGSMNMLLHGVENPDITYRDSLAQDHAGEEEKYTLVLANPPFAGSLDYESCAKDLPIMNYLKRKYNLLIGERTAEQIKIEIGSAYALEKPMTMEIKGRSLIEGVPKTITVDDSEIREALSESVSAVVSAIRVALERTPPELSADISDCGLVLAGGGALLRNLDKRIREETGLSVCIADDPLCSVVLGTAKLLNDFRLLRRIAVD
jgi:hypothetical protein